MLHIRLGKFTDDCIPDVSEYFNYFKQKSWFSDQFVRDVIYDIDKTVVIKDEYLESPVFGGMAPERLSNGVKALILMKMEPNKVIYATRCGDNCSKWIVELAKERDLTIMLHHCMVFPSSFKAIIDDTGKEVLSYDEFVEEYYRYRNKLFNL